MEKENVKSEKYDWCIALTKLTGRKIKEIHGYLSTEFNEPVFKMSFIEFDDGTEVNCEGEHDFPYLADGTYKFDEEVLQSLYESEDEDE